MPTTFRAAAEKPATSLPGYQDDIRSLLQRSGTNAPEVDRLARIISGMQQAEWRLARGKRATATSA